MSDVLKQLFQNIDQEVLHFLTANGSFVSIPKNEIFIREGAKNYDISFIISGLCRGFYHSKGEEQTLFFRSEGDLMASYESIVFDKINKINFQAIEQTTLFTIGYEHIKTLEKKDLKTLQTINEILKIELANTLLRVENHISLTPKEHYLQFLKEKKELAYRVPLKYLASYIGIKAESLSRIRKNIS